MKTKRKLDDMRESDTLYRSMMELERYMSEKVERMKIAGRHGRLLVGMITNSGPQAILTDTRTYVQNYDCRVRQKFGFDSVILMRHIPYQRFES